MQAYAKSVCRFVYEKGFTLHPGAPDGKDNSQSGNDALQKRELDQVHQRQQQGRTDHAENPEVADMQQLMC